MSQVLFGAADALGSEYLPSIEWHLVHQFCGLRGCLAGNVA